MLQTFCHHLCVLLCLKYPLYPLTFWIVCFADAAESSLDIFYFLASLFISHLFPPFFPVRQPLSNAYHELAQVYTTNNPAELRSLVNKHSETFTRDNNTGLVKQCLSSLYKKNIQRLTKVRGHTCVTNCRKMVWLHCSKLWLIFRTAEQTESKSYKLSG